MKNFKLTPVKGNAEDKLHDSIQISFENKIYATIWADETITFYNPFDFYVSEVEYFLRISQLFYSFFNNIKGEEISNPIHEQYKL